MIFMEKESGELFELMVRSLEETDEKFIPTGEAVFRMGEFTLHGPGVPQPCKYSEMGERFEFIGVV